MARTYYILAAKHHTAFDRWDYVFGAYDKADVEAERDDMHEHGTRLASLKVLMTTDAQRDIDARIAILNKLGR